MLLKQRLDFPVVEKIQTRKIVEKNDGKRKDTVD